MTTSIDRCLCRGQGAGNVGLQQPDNDDRADDGQTSREQTVEHAIVVPTMMSATSRLIKIVEGQLIHFTTFGLQNFRSHSILHLVPTGQRQSLPFIGGERML
jgi:hypothetical protein